MARARSPHPSAQRDGVILLVVISLLVLFSLVGLAFVIYAEGQANNARIWREGEVVIRDLDAEMLLAYFLGQFIYGTDNPQSQLKGKSLAENLYGPPNTPGSTIPYSDAYGGGGGATPAYGAPYTYPDYRNPYLASIKAGD